MSQNIGVQVRIRPAGANPAMPNVGDAKALYEVEYSEEALTLRLAQRASGIERAQETVLQPYKYQFQRVYDERASQEAVYKGLVSPFMDDFFGGMNCCVFCYGQTGSGKTYTQTGGAGSYAERGLMPRALEEIYARISADQTKEYSVYISYCQILNEGGYDLLSQQSQRGSDDPGRQQSHETLQKVSVSIQEDGSVKTKNLSAFRSQTVEEALNILWNGDCCRLVTSTSQNQASSRSHCIFTIQLQSRNAGGETVRTSKFHFVDLAGSERVSETGADGVVLKQARYINTSLFHLESVIRALAQRENLPETHVPYRNSMMTLFLKDSLGGNSRTAMLATVAVEAQNIPESIATCQFAMQVGSIANKARVNEEYDPKVLISRLKAENKLLKEQLKFLREGAGANAQTVFSAEELADIQRLVREFLANSAQQTLEVGGYPRIQQAFRFLRDLFGERPASSMTASQKPEESRAEIARLKALLQQRDAEIEILTHTIGGAAEPTTAHKTSGPMYDYEAIDQADAAEDHESEAYRPPSSTKDAPSTSLQSQQQTERNVAGKPPTRPGSAAPKANQQQPPTDQPTSQPQTKQKIVEHEQQLNAQSQAKYICAVDVEKLSAKIFKDDEQIFALFQQKYYRAQRIAEDRQRLAELYKTAKAQAASLMEIKDKAEAAKKELISIVQNVGKETEETDQLKALVSTYQDAYGRKAAELRQLKVQIQSLEADRDNAKVTMKQDFVRWYKYAAQIFAMRKPQEDQKVSQSQATDDLEEDIKAFYKAKREAGM